MVNLSDFKTGEFGKNYGLDIMDGPLAGLHSRVVIVLDEKGTVLYSEQVGEIAAEPDYEAALAAHVKNVYLVDSFADAVNKAHELAEKPQVVVLSPACSSYDMFENFPQRGRVFKDLVHQLAK